MNKSCLISLLLAVLSIPDEVASTPSGNRTSLSYLDEVLNVISKEKSIIAECRHYPENDIAQARDCADILQMGYNRSGIYKVFPTSRLYENKHLYVYCDMVTNGGGWTVIQRRGNFQRTKDFFFKDWKSYKEGFGHLAEDFWLGNDNIYALTNQKLYSARFDLRDVEQIEKYALYDTFWIDDENHKYMLHLSDYSGNAGDSMTADHNNQKFSTKDQDNDIYEGIHCAEMYKGGWWFGACHLSNLNGLYHRGKHESKADGVNWHSWKGYNEALEWTEIKIRPKTFTFVYPCNPHWGNI